MIHVRAYLVEKTFDNIHSPSERIKQVVLGYNTIEKAQQYADALNVECKSCPKRAALHTKYSVIENPIHVRVYNADETYNDKAKNTG